MNEWWSKHFELLIKSGLSKKDLLDVVNSGAIELREGADALFEILYKNKIPLVIMSSSGLSGDAIEMYLKHEQKMTDLVHIVGNSFEWDSDGRAVNVHQPIIHALNKDATMVKNMDFYPAIRDRKNVILMGDNEGDVGMIAGFEYDNIVRIGFFNEVEAGRLKEFKKLYDVIIFNDGPIDYATSLVKEVVENK